MLARMAIAASFLFATSACAQDDKPAAQASASPYGQDTPLEPLAADPAAAAILNKDLPCLLKDAQYPMF